MGMDPYTFLYPYASTDPGHGTNSNPPILVVSRGSPFLLAPFVFRALDSTYAQHSFPRKKPSLPKSNQHSVVLVVPDYHVMVQKVLKRKFFIKQTPSQEVAQITVKGLFPDFSIIFQCHQ